MTAQHLIVAFHSMEKSLAALEWAINRCRLEDAELTVVHAASIPVSIHNGPSAAIAAHLGNSDWATVHSTVTGLGAPAGTVTVIDHGDVASVIAGHIRPESAVVLGQHLGRRRRHRVERRLADAYEVTAIRIEDHFVKRSKPPVANTIGAGGSGGNPTSAPSSFLNLIQTSQREGQAHR